MMLKIVVDALFKSIVLITLILQESSCLYSCVDLFLCICYWAIVDANIADPFLIEVDQIFHLACPASPIFYDNYYKRNWNAQYFNCIARSQSSIWLQQVCLSFDPNYQVLPWQVSIVLWDFYLIYSFQMVYCLYNGKSKLLYLCCKTKAK